MNNNIKIDYEWFTINNCSVKVLKCEARSMSKESRHVFVIIPGNPGSIGFYEIFAKALFHRSGIPVWGISHTGHSSLGNTGTNAIHPDISDCGLKKQIQFKVAFLKEEVLPYFDKIYLIGHSIGCYIILHIMDLMEEPKLDKGIMLFPTIERMAETPKGKWLTPAVVHARWLILWMARLIFYLPAVVKQPLLNLSLKSMDEIMRGVVVRDVLDPRVVDSCTFMGMQEMLTVCDRDDAIINAYSDKLIFYYGAKDKWCPINYYYEAKASFENVKIQLCQKGYEHAFVLNASEPMADIVAGMVKTLG